MQLPTIHMNGTSKRQLVEQLTDVSVRLDVAYEAMKKAAPNGRDYYPQGPEAMDRALVEFAKRLKAIDAVKEDIDAFINAIDEL
jgi:hypothetical protein